MSKAGKRVTIKTITQQAFDDVVHDNMQEFDMSVRARAHTYR